MENPASPISRGAHHSMKQLKRGSFLLNIKIMKPTWNHVSFGILAPHHHVFFRIYLGLSPLLATVANSGL